MICVSIAPRVSACESNLHFAGDLLTGKDVVGEKESASNDIARKHFNAIKSDVRSLTYNSCFMAIM